MITNEKAFNKVIPPGNTGEILKYITPEIRSVLMNAADFSILYIEEIRLRAGKPLILSDGMRDWFVDTHGVISKTAKEAFTVSQYHIMKTLEMMSENSIYAYQEDIKNGFLTLKGGHRVGICGKVVAEGGSIKNIKDISSLSIRVSRQVKGCSEKVFKFITDKNGDLYNTLLVGPPQCGKTTILRDVIRAASEGCFTSGRYFKTGVVDERSELCACYKGVAQYDMGIRTDILDACPKDAGMTMLVRSMSPEVIVTDEIGNAGDKDAVFRVINAGVKIITSAHGYSVSDLRTRREVLSLIEEKAFERYVVLSRANGAGTIEEVVDGCHKIIYKRTEYEKRVGAV